MANLLRPDQFAARLGIPVAINLVVCLMIALILWPILDVGLHNVLVHSLSIGMCAMALIMSSTLYMAAAGMLEGRRGILIRAVIVLVMGVVAYVVGSIIARAILGLPLWPLFPFETGNLPGHEGMSILFSIFGAIVMSSLFLFYYRFLNARFELVQAREREQAARRQAADAQLAMLRAQIEPHMLFNTLANVRALIRTNPNQAQEMVDTLISFLRATLSGSRSTGANHGQSTLGEEFDMLEHYLSLMKIRLADRLSYELTVPEELRTVTVPSFLLQPLVENAIRHGIEPATSGGHLQVRAALRDKLLHLRVSDTGVGFSALALQRLSAGQTTGQKPAPAPGASTARTGGLGLTQLRERLAHTYGQRATFAVSEPTTNGQANNTSIDIYLPLDTAESIDAGATTTPELTAQAQ